MGDDPAVLLLGARRKPGTSTKVRSGTLKQSQKRTKRAALMLALMSRQPASTRGWLATTPIVLPAMRAKPTTMFCAKRSWNLEEVALVHHGANHVADVVWLRRVGRDHAVELGHLGDRWARLSGAGRRVLGVVGGEEGEQLAHAGDGGAIVRDRGEVTKTPLLLAWVPAPPRLSLGTSSWVTVLMTSGPVMNM